ncbi:hypothetical protein [Niallia sp. Krafla_26]|uniref:hypothetical protein n=1 Tax=Niallia sp. Krafla_26 TaxID=3064703 RepID=UPI003D1624E8
MDALVAISLIISMVCLVSSVALLINEVVFKGLRKIKEIKLRPIMILFILYIVFFALFLIFQNN